MRWPADECIDFKKMAGIGEDFVCGEDLDAILAAIDSDCFNSEVNFSAEMDALIDNISLELKNTFECDFCVKVCTSKRGHTRHINAKHGELMKDQSTSVKKSKTAEEKIHPLIFKKCLQECVTKLSIDECYPEEIMNEFKAYSFVYDDVLNMYALIRDVIAAFNRDLNKFYPKFYRAFADAEASFKGLCRNSNLLLGFELANHVLAYLSECSFKDYVLTFKHETTQFSDKEKSIITYLSG